jgi:hypothetical protein
MEHGLVTVGIIVTRLRLADMTSNLLSNNPLALAGWRLDGRGEDYQLGHTLV